MNYVIKAFRNEVVHATMLFDDYEEALQAQETLEVAGFTVRIISEATEDLGFDDYDDEFVS